MSVPLRKNVRRCNPSTSPPLLPFPCDPPPPRAVDHSSPLLSPTGASSVSSPATFSPDGVGVGRSAKKEKRRLAAPSTCRVKFEEKFFCVDFLPAWDALAVGGTRTVRIVEVVEQTAAAAARPSAAMALRDAGTFGNLAKVEALAWYPAAGEATLAIVQLSRSVTVLFDCLARKEERRGSMARQWNQNAPRRSVFSATSVGSGLLSSAVLSGNLSVPSTPATAQQLQQQQQQLQQQQEGFLFSTGGGGSTAKRSAAGAPCEMIEAVIDTAHTRVERIAWDPHNAYTLALTSDATHFELWAIPVTAGVIHQPKLVLRPPAHHEQAITRGVAFSPSDPNLIIVIVDIANAGQVIVYDRRQVEVPRYVNTTGHCLTLAFHPTYCDLLAVCYKTKKTLPDSRVQFFRVLDEVNSPQRNGAPPVVEQLAIPPIDSFAPLHRIRWRPAISRHKDSPYCADGDRGSGNIASTGSIGNMNSSGDGTATTNKNTSSIVDVISSQLWFASVAQTNAQDISIWDATNGLCPIVSIRDPGDECEAKDCVWVNPLSLVSVFKNGGVVLTSFLDDSAEGRDTLFRFPIGRSDSGNCDVFSLSAILPTAAVVSDYFGRRFVARDTSSHIRAFYTRVVRAESCELIDQLLAKVANRSSTTSSFIKSMTTTPSAVVSRNAVVGSMAGTPASLSLRQSSQPQFLHATQSPHPVQQPLVSAAHSTASVPSAGGNQTPGTGKTPKDWGFKAITRLWSHSSEKNQVAQGAKEQQRKKTSSKPQKIVSAEPTTVSAGIGAGTASTPLSNPDALASDMSQVATQGTVSRGCSESNLELIFPTLFALCGKEFAAAATIPVQIGSGTAADNPLALTVMSPTRDSMVHGLNSFDDRQWQSSPPTHGVSVWPHVTQHKMIHSFQEGQLVESSNSSNRNTVPLIGSCQTTLRSPTSLALSDEDHMHRRSMDFSLIPQKRKSSALHKVSVWKDTSLGNTFAWFGAPRENAVGTSLAATIKPFLPDTAPVFSPTTSSPPCAPQRCLKESEEYCAAKVCEGESESMTWFLRPRSQVSPVIERFVLADETCGWAYVERRAEETAFVRYAREWQVGYETARRMHNARRVVDNLKDDDNICVAANDDTAHHGIGADNGSCSQTESAALSDSEAHRVDRRFARMMEHNAHVCMACERDLAEYNSRSHRPNRAVSLSICHDSSACTGGSSSSSSNGNAAVDPRAHLWTAVAHALRSHDVSLVTTLVAAQLDYAALIGDAQYCIVLYLLYGLWWRQRHCCMWCHPCPLVPHGADDHSAVDKKNTQNKKKPCDRRSPRLHSHGKRGNTDDEDSACQADAAVLSDATRRRWLHRALQWLEQYIAALHACGLHVALNELLLIVPRVTGDLFNPVERGSTDIAYKRQVTYVHCGMCRGGALVPSALSQANLGAAPSAQNSAPLPLRATEWARGDAWESDDNDDEDEEDDESGCAFSDSFASATTAALAVSSSSPLPQNASCQICHSRTQMVCVICEEIVEGMFFFLRACGHGGHVHHIQEWMRLSNECPRCGEPILSQ